MLLGERFRSAAALLVDRSLGLRNPAQLRALEAVAGRKSWLRGEYEDEAGGRWSELDVAELVQRRRLSVWGKPEGGPSMRPICIRR